MRVFALKVRPKDHDFPILAWLIMLFQGWMPWDKKAWSHNALMYTYDGIIFWVIDSSSKGVRIQSKEEFFSFYKEIEMVELEAMEERSFIEWTEKHVGKKYDFLQLFGLASKALNFISFNSIGSNYRRMICAEIIISYVKDKYDLTLGDPDNYDLEMTWGLVESVRK